MSVVVESERQDSAHMAGDRPREVTEYPLTEAAEAAPVLFTLSKCSVWRNRPLPPQLSHVDCQTDGTEDGKDVFITKISAPGRPNI